MTEWEMRKNSKRGETPADVILTNTNMNGLVSFKVQSKMFDLQLHKNIFILFWETDTENKLCPLATDWFSLYKGATGLFPILTDDVTNQSLTCLVSVDGHTQTLSSDMLNFKYIWMTNSHRHYKWEHWMQWMCLPLSWVCEAVFRFSKGVLIEKARLLTFKKFSISSVQNNF